MMNALKTEKSEFERKEDAIGIWMYGGMVLVLAGVIIETIPEFFGATGIFHIAHRVGGSTVAVGLGVEFVAEFFASRYQSKLRDINGRLISETDERAAKAEQAAAKLRREAEPRRLTGAQRE